MCSLLNLKEVFICFLSNLFLYENVSSNIALAWVKYRSQGYISIKYSYKIKEKIYETYTLPTHVNPI